jgi:hypothetical protein
MDTFTREDFDVLARHADSWCVSLYLTTQRNGNGMLQTPIRLKNLAMQAEETLGEHGMPAPEAHRLLRPLRDLPGRADFLRGISEGMAIFIDHSGMRAFRLPRPFDELVVVGKRFHIKPLLPLVAGDGKFFLLAASAKDVRLFQGNRWGLEKLHVPGLPTNLREALGHDQQETVRQVHSAGFAGARMQPGFHGQGGRVDTAKDDLLEFFHIVDRSLRKYLAEQRAPLVFAGVEYLFPIFKKAHSYQHLLSKPVVGNTETRNDRELHEAAWAIVRPEFESDQVQAVARCHRVAGSDYGLLQLERVLQACHQGQVDTLLLDPQQSRWGTFDPQQSAVHLDEGSRPGNEELLNLAIVQTVQNSGMVFPVAASQLPDRSAVAAILRYPATSTPIPQPELSVA